MAPMPMNVDDSRLALMVIKLVAAFTVKAAYNYHK